MRTRRIWMVAVLALVLAVTAAAIAALPEIVRRVAIARLHAITHRDVQIDRVELNIFTGRLAVQGLRVADGGRPDGLTRLDRLDVRIRPLSLLRGHLWIRDAAVRGSTVRIERTPQGFNISDLFESQGAGGALDVTVDHFTLEGGAVVLEDRALGAPRTWSSENIRIDARNVSTFDDRGMAEASSVTAGAPMSVTLEQFRLYPIHFLGTMSMTGLDLSLARIYFPPSATAVVDRGRASTTARVTYDARTGLRADATGQLEDVEVVRNGSSERLAFVPRMATRVADLVFRDGSFGVGQLELTGSASVLDPTARGGPRFEQTTVRASLADLTWPITAPGQLSLDATVPGGGAVTLTGALRAPPASSQLRLRLSRVNLAPWARLMPVPLRIAGRAESDLSIDAPLAASVPAQVRGTIAVEDLSASDSRREVIGARRVEASGLEVHWPRRLAVKRLLITAPRAVVERETGGTVVLASAWRWPQPAPAPSPEPSGQGGSSTGQPPAPSAGKGAPLAADQVALDVGEIAVRDGSLAWRDAALARPVALDVSRIDVTATGIHWPLRGRVGLRGALSPPRGGRVEAQGQIAVDPLAGNLHVTAKDVDLSPYSGYVRTAAHVAGWADADLDVRVPAAAGERPSARGTAALSRVDVRDEERTMVRLERGVARGLDVVWPERITVAELTLARPWILVERDDKGAVTLGTLLPTAAATPARSPASAPAAEPTAASAPAPSDQPASIAVKVAQLVVEEGGARVVDRSLSPPFAVDLSRLAVRVDDVATRGTKPARVSVKGRVGADSLLDLSGTIGPIYGPLRVDVDGKLQGFWIPRTDAYLLRYVGWEARQGWLTTAFRCRIDGKALDANTDIRLSRLELARGTHDEAARRIGLPLGLITALMKDSRGDIHFAIPVGGRLDDPRFDFREAIWSTVRNVAIRAITLPVSWIGRVRVAPDSRVAGIQIDPVGFEPGTATPTAEGAARASRLGEFLAKTPEVRMVLTPAISGGDVVALRRRAIEAKLPKAARGDRAAMDASVRELFRQRFPDRAAPESAEAAMGALVNAEPLPPSVVADLAAQRIDAVKAVAKKGKIDSARLLEANLVQNSDVAEGQVAIDLAEPESPGGSGRRLSAVR